MIWWREHFLAEFRCWKSGKASIQVPDRQRLNGSNCFLEAWPILDHPDSTRYCPPRLGLTHLFWGKACLGRTHVRIVCADKASSGCLWLWQWQLYIQDHTEPNALKHPACSPNMFKQSVKYFIAFFFAENILNLQDQSKSAPAATFKNIWCFNLSVFQLDLR